jgi:hypothetical protein
MLKLPHSSRARAAEHCLCRRAAPWPLIIIAFVMLALPARAWDQAHGDSANTGFIDISTNPADLPVRKLTGLGKVAPGAGPVIGADGTVYLATLDGKLRAFTPDGDLKWAVSTPSRFTFQASPAIGRDGTIYVIGGRVARDHRIVHGETVLRYDSQLIRFSPTGSQLSVTGFPAHLPEWYGTGATSAAPILWRAADVEIVMIPVFYRSFNGHELRLLAFSNAGDLMFDQLVTYVSYGDVTGGWGEGKDVHWWCLYLFCGLNAIFGVDEVDGYAYGGPDQLPLGIQPPLPSVGIFGSPNPAVVVADNYEHLIGYNFSPTDGFSETFRKHLANDRISMSSPMLLPDNHSVISASYGHQGWLLFGGPNIQNWTEVVVPWAVTTPALTADGRIIVAGFDGSVRAVRFVPERSVVGSTRIGETIAPIAASCTHLFVSTAPDLVTFDARSLEVVARFSWRIGGMSPPAIGPSGAVYAVAEDSLFIFPAPRVGRFQQVLRSCRDVLVHDWAAGQVASWSSD